MNAIIKRLTIVVLMFFPCLNLMAKNAVTWKFNAKSELIKRVKEIKLSSIDAKTKGYHQLFIEIEIDFYKDKARQRVTKAWYFPNSQAISEFSNDNISFNDLTEQVVIHEAATILPNGETIRIRPDSVHAVSSDSYDVFTSSKNLVLHYPSLQTGSIALLEYETISEDKFKNWDQSRVFYTQSFYPRHSFKLKAVWHDGLKPKWLASSPSVQCQSKPAELLCTGNNIKSAEKDNSFAWVDELEQITLGNQFTSWNEMIEKEIHTFNHSLEKTAGIDEMLVRLTQNSQSLEDKISALHKFVAQDIRYVSFSEASHAITPHFVAETLGNRYGDCKDKSALLYELLHQIGVDAYPVLVATDRSKLDKIALPAMTYFNHMIVCFSYTGKVNCLDPTDSYTDWRSMPAWIQGKVALSLKNGNVPELIPVDRYRWKMDIDTDINFTGNGGMLEKQIRHYQSAYAGIMRQKLANKQPEELLRFAKEQYKSKVSNNVEPDFKFSGIESLSPVLTFESDTKYKPFLNIRKKLFFEDEDSWIIDEIKASKMKNKFYDWHFEGIKITSKRNFDTRGNWELTRAGAKLKFLGKFGSMVRSAQIINKEKAQTVTEIEIPSRIIRPSEAAQFNDFLNLLIRESNLYVDGKVNSR